MVSIHRLKDLIKAYELLDNALHRTYVEVDTQPTSYDFEDFTQGECISKAMNEILEAISHEK